MEVFAYARVSLDEKEGSTREQDPENQLTRIRAFCQEKGWTVKAEFVDKESGASKFRPGFRNMLLRLRAREVPICVVWKLDRLARFAAWESLALYMSLGRQGSQVVSIAEPMLTNISPEPMASLFAFITFFMAEMERYNTSIRTKLAFDRQASEPTREGKARGGRPKGKEDSKPRTRRWQVRPDDKDVRLF